MSEFIQNFHFIRPLLLLVAPLSVFGIYMLYKKQSLTNNWGKYIDAHLLGVMGISTSTKTKAPYILSALILVIASIAIAGPSWTKTSQPVVKNESALVLVWDLSPSMNARDLQPSRLTRSRFKIVDLLNKRVDGQTALIAYSGDAHVVAPLTDDTDTIKNLLPTLSPDIMPSVGSQIEDALALAIELLDGAKAQNGNIIVITDGIAASAEQAIKNLIFGSGHRLAIWGFGTDEGAPIELSSGGFAKNSYGDIVIAKLDDTFLSELALRLNAFYLPSTHNDQDTYQLISYTDTNAKHQEQTEALRNSDQWKEHGAWLILPLLFVFPFLFRKGWLCSIAFLFALFPTEDTYAIDLKNYLLSPDQQAQEAFKQGDTEKAEALFKREDWKAASQFKNGKLEEAAKYYAQGSSAEDAYNHGNSLALQNDFESAIDAYKKALDINPNFEKAANNKTLAEQILEQAQNQQEQNQQSEQDQQGQQGQQGGEQASEAQGNDAESDETNNESTQTGEQKDKNNQQAGQQNENQSGETDKTGDTNSENQNSAQQSADEDLIDTLNSQAEQGSSNKPDDDSESENNEYSVTQEAQNQDASDEENRAAALNAWKDSAQLSPEEQKLEQWLKQVPDDPGGLLRNKFLYQAKQKQQERSSGWRQPPKTEQRW